MVCVTGAALIIVAVFGGFAAGRLVSRQQVGFGLAIAVFLEATVVRSVLVPASMASLGDRNWYLPRWHERPPNFNAEGAAHSSPAIRPAAIPALGVTMISGDD